MKVQQFLEHHGIASNPFADEDAQTDLVFKAGCIRSTHHPTWDKVYGDPAEPATTVVFGEKGSGKTAMGLQIVRHLADHNANCPDSQVFVVAYDDFNPFLDRFRERFSGRKRKRVDRLLEQWRLWDHMDAILSLAVTQLVDRLLDAKQARHPAARDEPMPVDALDAGQKRDVMLLAACYDQSTSQNRVDRWHALRKRLGFRVWRSKWDLGVGGLITLCVLILIGATGSWNWLLTPWPYLAVAAGWLPRLWRLMKAHWLAWQVVRNTRVLNHSTHFLRKVFIQMTADQLVGQPMPTEPRSDDRYELLAKLQSILRALRCGGIVVLVDRVDEPYLINGSTELMRALVWPMLDNKLLKHSGIGIKLLLPSDLERLIDREDREFHQRARLDKQNLIRSLDWTGQSLYDVAAARVKACATEGASPTLTALFESAVNQRRLMDAFGALRVPRNLFKFMYRLITTHCNAHTDESPTWEISGESFQSVLALYQRDQDAFDRGLGAG